MTGNLCIACDGRRRPCQARSCVDGIMSLVSCLFRSFPFLLLPQGRFDILFMYRMPAAFFYISYGWLLV